MENRLDELTRRLAAHADEYDAGGDWPARSIEALGEFGCWRWMLPGRFGGDDLSARELIEGYEAIAQGCMSTALIFTQHDAAVDILMTCDNEALKEGLGRDLGQGRPLLTVGISQLTTSHQHGPPAMRVVLDGETARFTGVMPWATGADHADMIVTGGVVEDGGQVLAVVPTDAKGLTVERSMSLAALDATQTGAVRCDAVAVGIESIIRGPVKKALAIRGTVRPMVVSATGIGLAGAMVTLIDSLASRRDADMGGFADALLSRYESLRRDLFAAAESLGDPSAETPTALIRIAVNDLLVRLAILLTTFAKGTGFLRSHPAQRLVREALFFLVWSAPTTIQRGTLSRLLRTNEKE